MQIVLEVLDKYADQIDVKNVLEICLRNEKKRFRDFYKEKVIKNSSIEKAIQESVGKLLSLNEKANQAINGVNKRLDAFDKNIDNISKLTPIEPEINADGWYAQCVRCWHEITPTDKICPKCKQAQDWSWFGKNKKVREESV